MIFSCTCLLAWSIILRLERLNYVFLFNLMTTTEVNTVDTINAVMNNI